MKPFLSVIIPVYNMENTLKSALDSLMAQSFKNFEIILINDGSTDGTEKIVEEYKQKSSQIKYFFQVNSGVSAARNVGLEIAEGDLIIFMDADDDLTPDYFFNALHNYNNEDVVITGITKITNNISYIIKPPKEGVLDESIFFDNFVCEQLQTGIYGFVSNKFFKKSIVSQNNLKFDEAIKLCEDLEFFTRYYAHCKSFKIINEAGNYYRFSPKNSVVDYISLISVYESVKQTLIEKNKFNTANANALQRNISELKYAYFTEMSEISTESIKYGVSKLSNHPFLDDNGINRTIIKKTAEFGYYNLLKNYLYLRNLYVKIRRM